MNAAVAMFIFRLVPEFLMRFLAWLLIHTMYRVDKHGLEHIPEEGACVIACNHVSYVDAVVISACVRRPDPLRDGPPHLRHPGARLRSSARCARSRSRPAKEDATLKEQAFADAAEALREGEIVGIFPEGSLTATGEMGAFRPGLERIVARDAGAGDPDGALAACGAASSRAPTTARRCGAGAASSRASRSRVGGAGAAAVAVAWRACARRSLALRGPRR